MKAVFLDRDGCINDLVFYPPTGDYEAPYTLNEIVMLPGAVESIRRLHEAGFLLFIVSNQASYAKGKTSLGIIKVVSGQIEENLRSGDAKITHAYYCYHHPKGMVPEVSISCGCRKPGTDSLIHAINHYGVDISKSWMVGDSDTDIECGQKAGCLTILILNKLSSTRQGSSIPTLKASSLMDATEKILAS